MNIQELLACPVCKKPLFKSENSLRCEERHSFDFAKSGYINLLNPGKKNNAKAGDSKEMIRARSDFFATGCYEQIRATLCSLAKKHSPKIIIDAGCGEGYYASALALVCDALLGFDMSKFGTEHASKIDTRSGISSTLYAVANIFDMPVYDGCADLVVNMFAPVACEEFYRVLRSGGHLIIGSAGACHLKELKNALYDEVYLNEVDIPVLEGFELVERKTLSYSTTIPTKEAIWSLFQMTPYYHRTSLSDKAKLDAYDSLTTTVEVDFFVLRKI